jgi:AraC-like DNA-binding protein
MIVNDRGEGSSRKGDTTEQARMDRSVRYLCGDCRCPVAREECPPALLQVREYLNDHYDEEITLKQASMVAGLSIYHLCRRFRRVFGVTVHRYLKLVRLDRSRPLLLSGLRIADVAAQVGFFDQSHFHHAFASTFGMTPGKFRASQIQLPGRVLSEPSEAKP